MTYDIKADHRADTLSVPAIAGYLAAGLAFLAFVFFGLNHDDCIYRPLKETDVVANRSTANVGSAGAAQKAR